MVREWLERVEVKTLYIEPGSPWENGYNESFNGTLGEEVLRNLSTTMGHSTGLIREQCPVW